MSLRDTLLAAQKRFPKAAIILTPAMELPAPRRPRGRPRIYPKDLPKGARYKGYRGGKGKNTPPVCLNRGCRKYLRVNQPAVCSDACGEALFLYVMRMLRLLGVSPDEVLSYLTSDLEKTG